MVAICVLWSSGISQDPDSVDRTFIHGTLHPAHYKVEYRAGVQTKGLGKQRDAELLPGRSEVLSGHQSTHSSMPWVLCGHWSAGSASTSKLGRKFLGTFWCSRQILMFKALANQMSLPTPHRHSWAPPLEHPCPSRAGGTAPAEPSGLGTPWGHPKVLETSSAVTPREAGHKSRSPPSILPWRAALLPRNLPETQTKVLWLQIPLRVLHCPIDEF